MELLSTIFNFFIGSKTEPKVSEPVAKAKKKETKKEISNEKSVSAINSTKTVSTGYCLRCKAQRHMLNPEIVRVSVAVNRYHDQLKGTCVECSRTIVAFTKQ